MAVAKVRYKKDDYRTSLVARHGLAAAVAVASEAALSYPLDTVKSLLQVTANAEKSLVGMPLGNIGGHLNLATLVAGVRSSSGVGLAGLYGGVGWQLLGRLPVLGVRFGVYELSSAFITDGRSYSYVTVSEACLAGLFAGSLESLIAAPFDFLKLRAQVARVTPAPDLSLTRALNKARWTQVGSCFAGLPAKHPNMVAALQDYPWLATGSGKPPLVGDVVGLRGAIQLEGSNVLWRGLRSGLFRDASYGGVFFGSWHFLCDLVLEWKAFHMDHPPSTLEEVDPLKPWQLSVTAGLAGSGAAVASHTLDTAMTRTQATVLPQFVAMERKLLKWIKTGSWFQRTAGISPFDEPLLWRGLGIGTAQQGLAAAALVGTYHLALEYLMHQYR